MITAGGAFIVTDGKMEVVFVHGFATSVRDLRPLVDAFERRGARCSVLELSGHGKGQDLQSASVSQWIGEICSAVDVALSRSAETYLVGFSFGATLALHVAAKKPVAGVLCLSTFRGHPHPWLAAVAASRSRFPPVGRRRRVHVTSNRSLAYLEWPEVIPGRQLREVLQVAPSLCTIPDSCPVLFVHSINDSIAAYRRISELVSMNSSSRVQLITLSQLDHFIQFDIQPEDLADLAFEHFKPEGPAPEANSSTWLDNISKREEEIRHWSQVVSLFVLLFFTTLWALLSGIVPEVLNETDVAPYFLLSLPVVMAVYLQLALLYYFYMDRAQAYIKTYLEPFGAVPIGWIHYRTTKNLSGNMSSRFTRSVGRFLMLVPLGIAGLALAYGFLQYSERIFSTDGDGILKIITLAAVLAILTAVVSMIRLSKYTRTYLYDVPPLRPTTARFLVVLGRLYGSVSPGSVVPNSPTEGVGK